MNIFESQRDFIDRDPRVNRIVEHTYPATVDVQTKRNTAFLPPNLLQDASVLDLGCCVAASGGWALSHGAKRYVGVEISEKLCGIAKENLSKYHPDKDHRVVCSAIEDFLENNAEQFDIVIAAGVIFHVMDQIAFLTKLADITQTIVIDNHNPKLSYNLVNQLTSHAMDLDIDPQAKKALIKKYQQLAWMLENDYPFIEFRTDVEDLQKGVWADSYTYNRDDDDFKMSLVCLSMGAMVRMMDALGFDSSNDPNEELKRTLPDYYNRRRRFAARFTKTRPARPMAFKDLIA